ncbi:MAG: DegT/DnrJ/EryC1/StrS family aminotransferase [Rhodothermales bacterium]
MKKRSPQKQQSPDAFTIVKGIVRHQISNVSNLLKGLPVQPPSIGSMTHEMDDVRLAKKLIKAPEQWYDEGEITSYEEAFATWNGSKYAYAFMGGRVALSAAIHALELKAGDEVIIPGYTCVVVPNAFEYEDIVPVYADIELDTYGLSAKSFRERITPKTKAVVLQHLFGLVARDYEEVLEIARAHKISVIEDCAHATGALYKNKRVGNAGDVAFYSSELSKVFNTIQGGIVVTNNAAIAERIKAYKQSAAFPSQDRIDKLLHNVVLNYYRFKHNQRWAIGDYYQLRYFQKELISTTQGEIQGQKPAHYGARLPAPLASIGKHQLKKIDRFNEMRTQQAAKWTRWCEKSDYKPPVVISDSSPVWLRYPVLVAPEKKQNTTWALRELGVRPGVWFLSHLHPKPGALAGCPNADIAVAQCINLPTLI